jgi:hypothetical protein
MAGICGVARRSIAVMRLAGRPLPGWLGTWVARTSCPRCPCASLCAGVGSASGQWQTARTGPAAPVPGSPGNLWRGVKDGRADRISRVGQYPAHVRPGVRASAAAGRWLSGMPGRVQDGGGTVRCSWTQLDVTGHDPEPASRWPGTLRDYGRHTDRTRYSHGGKWGNSRSVAIPVGRDRLTVKPSA